MKKIKLILLSLVLFSCEKENIKEQDIHQLQLQCDDNIIALANFTDEYGIKHTNKTVDKKVFIVNFNEVFEIKSTTINQNKFVLTDLTTNIILDSVTTNNYYFKK